MGHVLECILILRFFIKLKIVVNWNWLYSEDCKTLRLFYAYNVLNIHIQIKNLNPNPEEQIVDPTEELNRCDKTQLLVIQLYITLTRQTFPNYKGIYLHILNNWRFSSHWAASTARTESGWLCGSRRGPSPWTAWRCTQLPNHPVVGKQEVY